MEQSTKTNTQEQTRQVILERKDKVELENLMLKITLLRTNIELVQKDIKELIQNMCGEYGFSIDDIIDVNSEQGIITVKTNKE